MADADQIMQGLDYGAARYSVLVPNMQGFAKMQELAVTIGKYPAEIAVFLSATEGFSQANLNCSIAESVERLRPVVAAGLEAGLSVRGYLSCVVACPFDGPTAHEQVERGVATLLDMGCGQVSLGDTIGAGVPDTVDAMLGAVLNIADARVLAGHFHDTCGRALANIDVSLDRGLRIFDSSAGGLGGCPYAPGAPGNVATESVVRHLHAKGYETGIDADTVQNAPGLALGNSDV
jgi:hydroxymethylglutaryl-CoA lyase